MVLFHQVSHFPEQGHERSLEHPPMLQVRHKPTLQFGSQLWYSSKACQGDETVLTRRAEGGGLW